ncbi:MAG: hypothetical protein Q7K37_10415 [Dehalococcoidia bacterium]|nr:hypothetical protein [Dehalococcoidia bacterium]
MSRTRSRSLTAAALVLATALGWLAAAPATAQEADGLVAGQILMGTAGATLDESVLQVRLVILEEEAVAGTVNATVTEGRYEARVPAVLSRTYVPVITYRDIQYFVPPAILDPSAPEVVQDVTVYETTTERPDLTIESTTVTLVAIDRDLGQMGFLREDLVRNPGDRVYIGDDRGVTLRLPVPEGTLEGTGDNPEGTFTLEAGAISVALPIRPLSTTSVVTRTLVEYDVAEDEYTLRVTAPLAADLVQVRVPEGFLRGLDPQGGAGRAGDVIVGEAPDTTTLQVVSQATVGPGQGLIVRLDGFAPERRVNALTEARGAMVAALVTLLVVGGAVTAATLRRRSGGA